MIKDFESASPKLAKTVFVAENASVIGDVQLAEDSSVFFNCVLRGDINRIEVGKRTNIQDGSVIHVSSNSQTTLGEDISVGHLCCIHACTLKDRILVGMGSIIMDGVQVESDCIIGAGSLLPMGKSYPSGSLIMGRPAKVIRKLNPDEVESIKNLSKKYVGVKGKYLAAE